jgi:MoaA/NifB/PqqE/SkfB family radical SAM enzyme
MLIRNYGTPWRFLLILGPSLFRVVLRSFWGVHHRARLAALRVFAGRVWRWLPGRIRQWRDRVRYPVTLQIVDDVNCRAGCDHCVFNAFDVRGPGLSLDDLDRLFRQALELNVTNIYLMGADPFYRANADAFLGLLAGHRSQMFFLFTEGKRVTPGHLDAIRRAGNIVPVMNIDGLRDASDRRKGPGTFDVVDALLCRMRDARMPYFVTCMVSAANYDEVTGPDFCAWLQDRGAFLLAFLPYTPVDHQAERDLVMDAPMRAALFDRSLDLARKVRRMAVLDLLGIEEHLTSCPAAHDSMTVYQDGTLTPCPAVTLGRIDANVRDRTLRDLFRDDGLYRAIRERRAGLRNKGEKPGCLFYGDRTFLREYLAAHPGEVRVLNPGSRRIIEEEAD